MSRTRSVVDRQKLVGAWFDAHAADLGRYAARRVGSDTAGDVVAETFTIALERFDRFDSSRGEPRAWLFGIATHVIRRFHRTETRRLQHQANALRFEPPTDDATARVDEQTDAARAAAEVLDAIAELRIEDRELILLSAWELMNSQQVAAVVGQPAATVRTRLRRLRWGLRTVTTRYGVHQWTH